MNFSFLLAMKFEVMLTGIIILLLLLKIDGRTSNGALLGLANVLLLCNFLLGFFAIDTVEIFNGMFRTTPLLNFEKSILNLAILLISLFSYSWLKRHKHLPEFFMLLLASLIGLFFMMSSNNLLMFYLGLELSTIPLAALCNFDLEKKVSSEAAMKMILSSAFSSGVLLFGISLIYGATGSLNYGEIHSALNGSVLDTLGFILLFTGFAFKLSVAPFHLWTADVYEGSPVAVTAFLSVVSKGAMAFVFVTALYKVFGALGDTWYLMLAFTSVLTMVIGNLFALRQTNLKRFLAFSSIAQVGYLLIGISGMSQAGAASVVYFILIYVFSNLAAFAVISVISSLTGKETLDDYNGLYFSNPLLALTLTLSLFSLAGIPPTAGFFGKLFLLTTGSQKQNWALIIIASLNLVISLYYYLRIVRVMFVNHNEKPFLRLNISYSALLSLVICIIGILVTGFIGRTFEVIYNLAANL